MRIGLGTSLIEQEELDYPLWKEEGTFEDQLKGIESTAPKDLVKEYQTPEGTKVREVGPLVYGYSMTIESDGKPKVREFGNMRPSYRLGGECPLQPNLSSRMKENH